MTEQTAMIVSDRAKALQAQVQEFVPILRELVVNGNKLTDDQIRGRAMFAAIEHLDPVTEVQTLVDKDGRTLGHTMAMTGYRRKCQEQVGPGSEIALEFAELPRDKMPNGAAVGYECRMRVGDDYVKWQKRLLEVGKAFKESGVQVTFEQLVSVVGQPPMFTGIGIVYQAELNPYKDAKYPPHERAQKRAESNARRKRFPSNAPVYDGSDNGAPIVSDAIDVQYSDASVQKPEHTEAELLGDLGYEPISEQQPEQPSQPEKPEKVPPMTRTAVYTGQLAQFGKNKYPLSWCQLLSKYQHANMYEIDGILQKLNLPSDTKPQDAAQAVHVHVQKNHPERFLPEIAPDAHLDDVGE